MEEGRACARLASGFFYGLVRQTVRNMADIQTLVRAWVLLQENWWAHGALDDAAEHDPELAWSVICRVLADSPTQEVVEVTAAGPLEDFLKQRSNEDQ